MKETSGEFSMTVVVLVGAILLVGFLSLFAPKLGNIIEVKWNEMFEKSTYTPTT